MATSAEFQSFRIDRDDGLPLAFTGVLLAQVESSPDWARSDYSGATGRWQRFAIYRTQAGAFVCARHNLTQWQDERDELVAEVVPDLAGIAKFFGIGALARTLIRRLFHEDGIDLAEHVE